VNHLSQLSDFWLQPVRARLKAVPIDAPYEWASAPEVCFLPAASEPQRLKSRALTCGTAGSRALPGHANSRRFEDAEAYK